MRSSHVRAATFHRLRVEPLESRQLLAGHPVISEVMAINRHTLLDIDGLASDWFEVHNPTPEPIDLLGYTVTDEPGIPDKWPFSDVTLDTGDYLVVFASEKDRSGGNVRFRLTRDFISTPDGTFLVDLPEGSYEAAITMGDADKNRDEMVIYIQGVVADTVTTQAGKFMEKTYMAQVAADTGGQLAIRWQDAGGQTGRAAINGLVITSMDGGHLAKRFDFGPPELFDLGEAELVAPIQPGYTPISVTDTYTPAAGYGWAEGAVLSQQDRGGKKGEQHANFRLDSKGDYLALVSPEGIVVSEYGAPGSTFPQQHTDVSYGIVGSAPGSEAHYLVQPTPGAANSADAVGFVADTRFSVDRGFYDAPFDLEISTSTPGASIAYTTDGTEPTLQHGTVVTAADANSPPVVTVRIDTTTVLRAAAFKDNHVATNIDAQTYFFVEDIIQQDFQSTLAAGFPRTWYSEPPDYGMDRNVIGPQGQDMFDGRFAATIRDDLKAIPTMSLVMDIDDMFGPQGIYSNTSERGQPWERPVSVEYIDPSTGDEFQLEAGIRIQGGASRTPSLKKHSLRLLFKDLYGASKLRFPLFGESAANRFDTIYLRANLGDSWPNRATARRAHYTRDEFARRSELAMGQPVSHGTFVHLYINGIYWGLYNPVERPDQSFNASYFGGEKDSWDALKHAGGGAIEVLSGSRDAWNTMLAIAREAMRGRQEDRTAAFMRIQGRNPDGSDNPEWETYLDVDNNIDYVIVNTYVGNLDCCNHNFYMARLRGPQSTGFKSFPWDIETSMGLQFGPDVNTTSNTGGPLEPYTRLRASKEYRLRFADRVHRHLFNDGALTSEATIARLQEISAEIDRAIVAESARWGDTAFGQPLTHDNWLAEGERIVNNFLAQRRENVLHQYREADLYPEIDAPEFEINGDRQHGGNIDAGAEITFDSIGQEGITVYYTLNGGDPREIGGAVSTTALAFQPGVAPAMTFDQTTLVQARILDRSGRWSAMSAALFVVATPELRVTELNYNPYDPTPTELASGFTDNDEFEFIELENVGPTTTNLLGTTFTDGIEFTFPSMLLDPGERVVVVKNRDAFEARYGMGIHTAGEFTSGSLRNSGENLTLVGPDNFTTILDFAYDDNDPWPERADGDGGTLELIDPLATLAEESGKFYRWRGSTVFGGSPGATSSEPLGVVINEVLSNTEGPVGSDSIELHNPTGSTIDIGGMFLSDSASRLLKYEIPSGTLLGPGAYVLFDESDFNPSGGVDPNDFGLSGDEGDEVWLIVPDGRGAIASFVDDVHFGASHAGESFGRSPNGGGRLAPMNSLTLGAANSAPRVGPLIISEVHYNPEFFQQDFNRGTAEGLNPLSGKWTVTGGRYEVTPEAQGDGVTTIPSLNAMPNNFQIEATVFIPADTEFNKNGAVIFDYQGPTDFKFASFHAGGGRWRIGHRDASAWNFLAELQQAFAPDTDHAVTVEIDGTIARVLVGGVQKVSYDFGTPLGSGLVGLGSKNGQARFDEVVVGPLHADDLEFVEVHNPTNQTESLMDWRIRSGIDFEFDPDETIGPGETVVVIPFDPNVPVNSGRVAAFRAHYDVDSSVRLVGGYTGQLNNDGEVIQLQRPDNPPPGDPFFIPFLSEDEVVYDALSPWPTEADGRGKSLERISATAFGGLASSWRGANPSPGLTALALPGDMNRDGRVDEDDVAALVLALTSRADYEEQYRVAATLHGDLDGDGDLDFDDLDEFAALIVATRAG